MAKRRKARLQKMTNTAGRMKLNTSVRDLILFIENAGTVKLRVSD